jgi:hypothetical protein
MYDGAHPKPENTPFTQTLHGFYQSTGTASRLAFLAGVGGNNATEQVSFNGTSIGTAGTNPFTVISGSGRTWNTKTFDLTTGMPGFFNSEVDKTYGEYVTTSVAHSNQNQGECEAFAAVLFSVPVKDAELDANGLFAGDGLPDGLEDPARLPPVPNQVDTYYPVTDPDGLVLPNLYAMGARVSQRDLIAEINATKAAAGTEYGSEDAPYYGNSDCSTSLTKPCVVEDLSGHHHVPSPEVLKMVGDVYRFKASPSVYPHFDMGNPADYYNLFCGTDAACISAATTAVGAYLVPASVARGGEMVLEKACTVDPDIPNACQFPDWPGTISYPLGLQLTRDAPVFNNGTEVTSNQLDDWATGPNGTEHRRRFDLNRRDFVHYLLYAHARARARSPDPCLDSNDEPANYGGNGTCNDNPDEDLRDNPLYHIPSSASGIADLPGSKALITLGLWDPVTFTASPFVQASTTVHEMGHHLYLWHGGWPAFFGDKDADEDTVIEPNCKPNYLSSMSYMFQVHGLYTNAGAIELNYSGGEHAERNESSLTDSPITSAAYRAAWYAPFASTLAQDQGATVPASRFCSGTRFDPLAPTAPAPMARVLADTTSGFIDWNGDLTQNSATNQDVNFTGPTYNTSHVLQSTEVLRGYNDWANIHLNQIGAAPQVAFFTSVSSSGDRTLTLDAGSGGERGLTLDLGSGGDRTLLVDGGSGVELRLTVDAGSGVEKLTYDLGSGGERSLLVDLGSGDRGLTLDLGSGGDRLLVDGGSGIERLTLDLGGGDRLTVDAGSAQDRELTLQGALEGGRAAPSAFDACVIGDSGCPAPGAGLPLNRTYTSWTKPTFGTVAFYHVSRRRVGSSTWEMLPNPTTNTFYVDEEELPQGNLPAGVQFRYRVQAEFDDGEFGPASNADVITAHNIAPVANDDLDPTVSGFVINKNAKSKTFDAPGMLANDTDQDLGLILAVPGTFTTAKGGKVVIEASGRFTYTPKKGTSDSDSFTYTATNGKWSRNDDSPDFQQIQMNATLNAAAMVTIKIQ